MLVVSIVSFFLMGILNTIGIIKIGVIANRHNLKAKRKWLFIDTKDFKNKLEEKADINSLKAFKLSLILIGISKILFLTSIIFFILSIDW